MKHRLSLFVLLLLSLTGLFFLLRDDRRQPDAFTGFQYGLASMAVQGDTLFVGDGPIIRLVDLNTGDVAHLTGSMHAGYKDGAIGQARYNLPFGLAARGDHLYVADAFNNRIRLIHFGSGRVFTLAGVGMAGFADGPDTTALFRTPQGLAVRGDSLYVADAFNNRIRVIRISTGYVSTLAGAGTFGFEDGPALQAKFRTPQGLAIRGDSLYVADTFNNRIRLIHLGAGHVSTLAGSGKPGTQDGPLNFARFKAPLNLALQGDYLFIAEGDASDQRVRMIRLDTEQVSTAYTHSQALGDHPEGQEMYHGSWAVAAHGDHLFVAESNNRLVRVIRY